MVLNYFTSKVGHPENKYLPLSTQIGAPEVARFRELLVLEEDASVLMLDSWGVKRLFSHVLRRWLAGSAKPREPCHLMIKLFSI